MHVYSTNGRLKAKPFITVDLYSRSNSEIEDTTDHDSNQSSMIKIMVDTSFKTVEVIRLDSFNLRN